MKTEDWKRLFEEQGWLQGTQIMVSEKYAYLTFDFGHTDKKFLIEHHRSRQLHIHGDFLIESHGEHTITNYYHLEDLFSVTTGPRRETP